jgi:hypothetical protein
VTTILLVGAGATGTRAARQLVDTPGLDRLLVADRDPARAAQLAAALGASVATVPLDRPFPREVDAVALAIPARPGASIAVRAVEAGAHVAAIADECDGIAALLGLAPTAEAADVMVVVGCGLVPGLGDVLARHAADSFDEADEVHLAWLGAAGPACVDAVRRARREPPIEWRDAAWHSADRRGHELVWFPDPVGGRECEVVAPDVELLCDAVAGLQRATVRVGPVPERRRLAALALRRPLDDGWGGVRVEVWGWRGQTRDSVVYGMIERPAVGAGTVLAVATARLAGLVPHVGVRVPLRGARALGAVVEPAAFLGELARRGVKAAVFEGVGVG